MKRIIVLFVLAFVFVIGAQAQETCEELPKVAEKYLKPASGSDGVFISDGQTYRAFLDGEQKAEYEMTFYGGSTYRIAATAGSQDAYVIFSIRDQQGNTLFTNKDYENAPYWDFEVASTINCTIVAQLDQDLKASGCAIMLVGFKQ